MTDKSSQGRSGNPGYIDGLPVLVGKADLVNVGAQITPIDGFKIVGADATGKCTTSLPEGVQGDPTLQFNLDLSYGCGESLDLAELQAFCEDAASLDGYDIFGNLNNFESFG